MVTSRPRTLALKLWFVTSTHLYSQLPYNEVRPPVHVALLDNGPVYDNRHTELWPPGERDKNVRVYTTSSSPVANVQRRHQLVLLGDSYAAHRFPALSAAAKIHGWTATCVRMIRCCILAAYSTLRVCVISGKKGLMRTYTS